MNKKVIVAGHICLDITPVFHEKKYKNVADILQPGKLIEMGDADVHTGGAVANTGLAMKILGVNVALMGKVGNDEFGDMICNILDKYDASSGMIRAKGESTSYSVVLAIPGIDRMFLHNPGANNTFTSEDLDESVLKDADLMHFGYPPLMRKMYEDDGKELINILKKAKECNIATSLDMAAIDPSSEAGKANWEGILGNILPMIDFFVPSVEELLFMLDKEKFALLCDRAGNGDITDILDIEKDVKPLADKCMRLGASVLLIKCGALGMYYRSNDKIADISLGLDADKWINRDGFEKSYIPEKVVSGTGAGDTSIAAFLTSMLEGYSFEECMQLATATGASCVEAIDALSGLKTLEDLRAKINRGWNKRC